ncbi:MAG TPA: hypothetical protein VG733_08250, partial [Chthoniobacteraceae bacterium]|nr:hypothetical protein [Chthoniobacteraceae bacterium]
MKQPNETDVIPANNSIIALLQNQRAGACLGELSEQLSKLGTTVRETGAKGKLTLEITMTPL